MHTTSSERGFTLVEMAITLAIIAILAGLAYSAFSRMKPRSDLAGAATELQALIHQARQQALADARPVSVLIYPSHSKKVGSQTYKGYVIIYEDACFDFFAAVPPCGVGFGTYDPAVLTFGASGNAQSAVVDTMMLPPGVIVGPAVGMGSGAKLPAPLASVPVATACSFCGTTAGAVQFDTRGRATFYSLSGGTVTRITPDVGGQSVSLGYDPDFTNVTGQRTLVILSGSGAVETIVRG